jgi:signal transduction histidine kinase
MYFTTEKAEKAPLPFYKTVLFLVCVLILIGNGASLFHNLASLRDANDVQGRTARVADKLQYLNVLVMDAESSLRGYFLSGSDVYLGPLHTATVEVDNQFKELDRLVSNASQRKNLDQLRTLVRRKLANMEEQRAVYRQGGLHDIVRIAAVSDDKTLLDEIRLLVVIMIQEQNEQLATRSKAFYSEYQYAVALGIGINALAIVVLALFYRLIRRSYFSRMYAQQALQSTNEKLESMVVVRTEQLSVLSRHLIRVSEEEKARLARELHDELGANLTGISMDINAVSDRLRADQPELAAMLERARATLVDTVELKRRIVENLRPSLLDNLGLAAALHSYCEEFARVTGLDCDAMIDDAADHAGPTHAIAVFRIVQESLNNVAKYAQARTVIVQLSCEEGGLALEVIDDGIGITVEAAGKAKSHGLLGMRERALLLGGTLHVRRGVNEVGTCVVAFLPLAAEAAAVAGGAVATPPSAGLDEISAPHLPADGRTATSPPYSIHPHSPRDLGGQVP